jgi:hypothetical protein
MMLEPKNMLNQEAQASNSQKAADQTIGALDARQPHEADGTEKAPAREWAVDNSTRLWRATDVIASAEARRVVVLR